ncbi:hypothetical protein [Methylobacterium sp. C1]|uniref:hypothetical protein n=1 Tax=Methylobacterium sp. C1 TaxID=1479019 RepID=UPI001331B0DD|nr:hypothetical protein [Methylobacterium sp. C1]
MESCPFVIAKPKGGEYGFVLRPDSFTDDELIRLKDIINAEWENADDQLHVARSSLSQSRFKTAYKITKMLHPATGEMIKDGSRKLRFCVGILTRQISSSDQSLVEKTSLYRSDFIGIEAEILKSWGIHTAENPDNQHQTSPLKIDLEPNKVIPFENPEVVKSTSPTHSIFGDRTQSDILSLVALTCVICNIIFSVYLYWAVSAIEKRLLDPNKRAGDSWETEKTQHK